MPLDTILCLDTSGSMAGRGLRELKRAVETFLDGVQQTAQQTGLQENVAIVEFGNNTRVVQSLTTNYALLKRKAASLTAGSTTPMFEGLMLAMKEIMENGGVLALRGTNMKLTPRVILMTDGRPDNKEKVLATAIAFSPKGWSEVGLPHPIPIACVGCGDVDKELLAVIAVITNGMFAVGDATELSTFFRRQVLLIRFLIQFHSDMSALRDLMILKAFLEQLGESVDDEETEALMKLLLAMLVLAAVDDDDDDDDSGVPAITMPTSRARPAIAAPPQHSTVTITQLPSDDESSCCCVIL